MRHLLLLCVIIFSFSAHSQPNSNSEIKDGSISGRVLDAQLNQPLPYVNVIVKDAQNKIITGSITDDNGQFEIKKIPEGPINIEVTFIGYKTIQKQETIGKDNYNINMGDIMLEEDVAGLDEVTVVAERSTIEQKIDRKVINVGKDLTTSGPTASDIMNNIPSVNVDQQTGDISLRGNQNVQVMIDGKLSNIAAAQLLKQIPSTSIKKIELITNPSAKYNPEGMSGIINIILHKNTLIGFNGNLNTGVAYENQAKFNSNIDLNYRNGKFNIYGNYGNNIAKNENFGNINRPDDNSLQLFNFLDNRKSHLYKLGVDVYINDKNTISVFTNQNIFDGGTTGRTRVLFENDMALNQLQTFENESENTSEQYNFDYKLDFDDEGHNIELEVDYNLYEGDIFSDNLFFGLGNRPNFNEFTRTERDRTTINLDYVKPLKNEAKLELGLQALLFNNLINYNSNARVRNQMGDYIPTLTDFDYSRDIYSAYVTYGKKWEKFSVQLGARFETVQENAFAEETDLTDNSVTEFPFENDYTQLYPSAFFTYTPSEKNSYQLSYSRRVDRPGVGQINPIPEWNTPLISSFGNQALLPQFTNSIETNYTRQLEKGSITGGVFYRIIEDEINRAVFIDRSDLTSGRIILTFDNFDNTTAYGLELSAQYKPTKWWNFNTSFDLFSQTQKGITETLDRNIPNPSEDDIVTRTTKVDNVAWNFRMFNNFSVNKNLTFSAFGFYRGVNRGIQFETQPMYFVNIGMRYNFLENKNATFSLNFNDVFDTMQFAFEGDNPFRQDGAFNWESRTIFAGLSYRFGGGKYRAKSRKNRDDNIKDDSGGFL
ncbi:TonB-dependent receptor domain-containing protein [Winogradskyella sp.]|uniref:TonB-dependent receptor domain-containing protein n=1 Tax=Winogradskyella sp. TaxID=1883156 RepID=UPI0035145497